ncbi:MAG: metal ABC transporter permease [candidate division WOR-3 bacterium]
MMGILEFSFARNALAGGLIMALFLPLLSFFVVTRRLSFTGVGISHSAFGGLALGVLLGINPVYGAIAISILVAFVMAEASRRGVPEDTTTGVLFAGTMALGAVLLALAGGTRVDLWTYLFGNILSLSEFDLLLLGGVAALNLGFLLLFLRKLLFSTFDPELAEAHGVRTGLLNSALLFILALSVVACMRAVGVVLISGLLVFPGSIGARVSRSHKGGIIFSYLAGIIAIIGGLGLSFWLNLPSGASVILVGTLIFLASLVFWKR